MSVRHNLAPQVSMLNHAVSPVVVEIVRNGVIALTEDMKTNLMRTSYNMIIYEALDFTVGLYTADGDTISIGLGLPSFIRGMSETVKAKIAHFGRENIKPGDILVTNDAFITGSHLNHITLTKPVFYDGELIAFTCCMAHWIDVGGAMGEITTDIYSEGLQIPIMKYLSDGRVNQTLIDIISLNVRNPSRALGDLRAQVIAVDTGEMRLLQLVKRYGKKEVLASINAIMDHSDATARARARQIPNGVYEAESFMDDDGVSIGRRIPIKVKVIVVDGEVTIDLSGVSPQVAGYYNSSGATGIACGQVAFKNLTSPDLYPVNDGSFRSLKVICPEGTIVSAKRPASMRWWMAVPMTIVDTIIKAMAPAIPHLAAGGHHAELAAASFHGHRPDDGSFFFNIFGPSGGGWGAKATEDGNSVTVCSNDGDTHNSPSEQVEARFPLLIEKYALRQDSGGAGKFRGGLGAEIVIQALAPMAVSSAIERTVIAPWGIEGGLDATPNEVLLRRNGVWDEHRINGKLSNETLAVGDAIMIRTGGGGGFGDPLSRDHEMVRRDLDEGYISAEAAASVYGLKLEPPFNG